MTLVERSNTGSEREDSYFVSITDMMIGLLFLFIILLMYFAIQLSITTNAIVDSNKARDRLLRQTADYMAKQHVDVEIDFTRGVLRFPDEILFDKGREAPKEKGVTALHVLADAMMEGLPCYSFRASAERPAFCEATDDHIEAIFIEGHTDSDPISGGRMRDNWDLSSIRATNTFRILVEYRPELLQFLSGPAGVPSSEPLLSVAGYADQRPLARGSDEASKSRNRRIDIRVLMAGPEAPVAMK